MSHCSSSLLTGSSVPLGKYGTSRLSASKSKNQIARVQGLTRITESSEMPLRPGAENKSQKKDFFQDLNGGWDLFISFQSVNVICICDYVNKISNERNKKLSLNLIRVSCVNCYKLINSIKRIHQIKVKILWLCDLSRWIPRSLANQPGNLLSVVCKQLIANGLANYWNSLSWWDPISTGCPKVFTAHLSFKWERLIDLKLKVFADTKCLWFLLHLDYLPVCQLVCEGEAHQVLIWTDGTPGCSFKSVSVKELLDILFWNKKMKV